jgi:hypothetical protein
MTRNGYVMPVKLIVGPIPHAVTQPGHGPHRLSLVASLAAAATLVACLVAGSAPAAPASAGRPMGFFPGRVPASRRLMWYARIGTRRPMCRVRLRAYPPGK